MSSAEVSDTSRPDTRSTDTSRPVTRGNSPAKKVSESPKKSPKKRWEDGTKKAKDSLKTRPPWSNAPSRPQTKDSSRSSQVSSHGRSTRINTAASKR